MFRLLRFPGRLELFQMFTAEGVFCGVGVNVTHELGVGVTFPPTMIEFQGSLGHAAFEAGADSTFSGGGEGSEEIGCGLLFRASESHIDKELLRLRRPPKVDLIPLIQNRHLVEILPTKSQNAPNQSAYTETQTLNLNQNTHIISALRRLINRHTSRRPRILC